ncbi:hypothetical protein [Oceanirhabdus seepicola]|uniref:Uncharacterized protein n=1 Tax=Oceanirhabdus seepicola TaxID=2828781 RepID=A0A9J6P305_9CLOT|nr:hypothetical protein [Oceanirhabdus seepicola]MCM1990449.1 hypothetical protein [Oceanirhabdus seepicola]MCM1990450.1 hypothetical protein [Oceanirhabdus seepicola]MCM1990452.1 hypothetical protein [Oceanirhabdus seepicola]MCM1990453.1 hypothetical protein [Oceanirhabdus seepicola]
MKRNMFLGKNQLLGLLEYKLEYREEIKRIDKEAKREIENNLLFIGM